ncbi:hypothetical protein CCM_02020 [Cordyceps militaris CM01]|uniref:Aminoglycoside phosphotransferase domain-containing protein n=1 Tax=Cordyceps militaris (strain CM01) TaxID=983644 RepID=G3JC86_CORMM|nr:uncharacterized protein CCM_02020 [Cordyceps militaris CM01]EGX93751.1 hypothetical protein CCM_02020 [Cordyceps militaris CM01]
MFLTATSGTSKSLQEAIESEDNELASMRYPDLVRQFCDAIDGQRSDLEHMICKLLQVSTCEIISSNLWISGSFNAAILHDDTVALNNRPLNLYMHMLENEGVASGIPRGRTYAEVDGYLSDLLSLQDAKLRGQPNAMFDVEDGRRQLAACAGMRAVLHHFVDPDTRQGPFYLTLNDLIQANIFVDEQWNVTSIIDLEWTHTLPAAMQSPPYWLTSKSVDGFHDQKDRQDLDEAVQEYLSMYEKEEVRRNRSRRQAAAQRGAWDSGGFWFFRAATVPKAMYNLFNWHIQPLFHQTHPDESVFDEVLFSYWGRRASAFVDDKMGERDKYVQELTKVYRDMDIVE